MTSDAQLVDRFLWERQLRASADVAGVRLLVLLTLGTYMDADGSGARPSQASLATATGQSERTVRRHLAAARAGGWVTLERRGHRRGDGGSHSSSYRASVPAGHQWPVEAVSTGQPGPEEAASTGHAGPVERSQPATGGPQPATGDRSTGHPCPPTTTDHVSKTAAADSIEREARAALKAALLAGDQIRDQGGWVRWKIGQLTEQHAAGAADRLAGAMRWGATRAHHYDPDEVLEHAEREFAKYPELVDAAVAAYEAARPDPGDAP
jgi:hypothetical protein